MTFEEFSILADKLNICVTNTVFNKLQVYFEQLVEWNEKINLTAITNRDDVFVLHFLDSAAGAKYIPQGASVCDIGTGAGFPGIVLKILRDDINLTLIDSLNKRVNFLSQLTEKLEIKATCIHSRAEDAGKNATHREKYDIVVSRAVAKLNTLYEYAIPLVKVGGQFIAYKANCTEEITDSKNVPKLLGGTFSNCHNFILPQAEANRSLIIIDKISATPKQYPRGKNKERDNPLK